MLSATTCWLILAGTTLIGLIVTSHAALRGWQGWLDLRRLEIETRRDGAAAAPSAASRIELADLRERLRRLEAIAAGVEP